MSRSVTRWALAATVAALLLSPNETRAQQTEEDLVRHIDSLLPLLEQAETEATEARVRREEAKKLAAAPSTDTFMVGPVRIVTIPEQRSLGEEIYRAVWDREYASFVDRSPSVEAHFFTFRWYRDLQPIYVDGPVRRVEMPVWRSRSAVEEAARQGMSAVLAQDLRDTPLAMWNSSSVRVPPKPVEIYRELALSASVVSRACIEGDASSCWAALGLGDGEDAYPLDDWYSPEERRALAGQEWASRQQMPLWDACVQNGETSSCDVFLSEVLERHRTPANLAPLGAPPRGAMLWIAVRMGGEGAWDRLRADPDASAAEALLAASGASRDELAGAWLDYVLENKPATRAGAGTSTLLALFWIAAFGALAMRSTRWRLG
jgi:hypothetical protein